MELIDWDNKSWKEKENGDFIFDLANITAKIFDETAKKWALVIANVDKGVEKNQLRNFYEKVLELEEKALNSTEDEFLKKVLPFVKMLNSKVAYAKSRNHVNDEFARQQMGHHLQGYRRPLCAIFGCLHQHSHFSL